MELGLSLGNRGVDSGCMGLGMRKGSSSSEPSKSPPSDHDDHHSNMMMMMINQKQQEKVGSSDPSLRLNLRPHSPTPLRTHPPPLRFPWLSDNLSSEPGSSDGPGPRPNRVGRPAEEVDEQSSPNSGTSSFMEFSLYNNTSSGTKNNNNNNGGGKRNHEEGMGGLLGVADRGAATTTTTSRGSDDEGEDMNGSSTRKKLRLSKQQSAFLEESFKEHHTLNPKQKQELAKQLNLRPRQVEVWFQNRRARTKLKQTEVDCEYLKRCCETLTEENRRLQKELQELRALKTSQPFFMQLPPTTLTMCPSCERVAPTATSAATSAATPSVDPAIALTLGKPKPILPFAQTQQATTS